jgi:hypothetical protein
MADNYIVIHINPEYVEDDSGATILNAIAEDVAKLLKQEHFDGVFATSTDTWLSMPAWSRWRTPDPVDPRFGQDPHEPRRSRR